jgi:Cu2+-exporting ATPase
MHTGAAVTSCGHCGQTTTDGNQFCCLGCETVAALLRERGLTRYYALGGRTKVPASAPTPRDHLWLAPLLARLRSGTTRQVVLDVQGLRCAACTWLLEETFRRMAGGRRILVDPGVGRIELHAEADFDLAGYVAEVERFGYVLGPPNKVPDREGDALLSRAGVAIAVAMNVMTFALAEYLGLSSGPLLAALRLLSVILAGVAVLVAAPPFLRGALDSLSRGVLSLDVPISLGILLASAAALHGYLTTGEPRFADTLSVFVALMLVGRVIERRALGRARRQLLDVGDVPALFVRRIEDGAIRVVPASLLAAGDELVIAPGEVVPVDGTLLDEAAEISLDWISGESRPEPRMRAEIVPAGAFVQSRTGARLRALGAFDDSPLLALLRRAPEGDGGTRFWDRVARLWAALVLAASAATLLGWGLLAGDWEGGMAATTAVLVVTCPCGIGIANPLAHELARATLRRVGLFVRTARALDRAADVESVVFDKTGTLTTGALRVAHAEAGPRSPSEHELAIALALASGSSHPKAEAVRRHLDARTPRRADVRATELVGRGVEGWSGGRRYALERSGEDTAFTVDGAPLLVFTFTEDLRADAVREVARLRDAGLAVSILSGDAPDRVLELGARLGVPAERCVGGASPEDKAAWLRARASERALFVGDGLNDTLAASAAFLSGTPAIDRPFLPSRTDFHFTAGGGGGGLSPIRELLSVGRRLRSVTRRNLGFAFAYNAVAIAIAASGAMHPWLAALLMPLSSLAVIGSAALAFPIGRARAEACPAVPLGAAWKS